MKYLEKERLEIKRIIKKKSKRDKLELDIPGLSVEICRFYS